MVRFDDLVLGDLGNRRVDARLLNAILLRDRVVADWLAECGVTSADVEAAFPAAAWPLDDRDAPR